MRPAASSERRSGGRSGAGPVGSAAGRASVPSTPASAASGRVGAGRASRRRPRLTTGRITTGASPPSKELSVVRRAERARPTAAG
ncbi:MAG: hypothetical protein EXR95_06710 [Gemmatimonadetes bacterium]|nr:hypothetical protein [Gemmatimonadota bacterium]